jgi:hypothetical protein
MTTKINSLVAVCVLFIVALGCNFSFTTANISSLNFGKNDKAEPQTTSFNVGEKVYAVAVVSNTSSKHKLKFKLTPPSGGPLDKDFDFTGATTVNFFFNAVVPGEYKIEAILYDDAGKEIDKKSGTVSAKGSAPTSSAPASTDKPKTDSTDADEDTDSSSSNSN